MSDNADTRTVSEEHSKRKRNSANLTPSKILSRPNSLQTRAQEAATLRFGSVEPEFVASLAEHSAQEDSDRVARATHEFPSLIGQDMADEAPQDPLPKEKTGDPQTKAKRARVKKGRHVASKTKAPEVDLDEDDNDLADFMQPQLVIVGSKTSAKACHSWNIMRLAKLGNPGRLRLRYISSGQD